MAPAKQRNAAYSLTPLPTRFLKEALFLMRALLLAALLGSRFFAGFLLRFRSLLRLGFRFLCHILFTSERRVKIELTQLRV